MWIAVLLAFVASSAWGQLAPEKYKYYRIQNTKTKRYVSVRDGVGSVNVSKKTADVKAVEMVTGFNNVVSDPATIIGLTDNGPAGVTARYFDASAQGTSISQIINKDRARVIIDVTDDSYLVYVTYTASSRVGSANAYLTDPGSDIAVGYADSKPSARKENGIWSIIPVTNDGSNYFGVNMDLSANGKYYTTLYTDFPYQLSEGMKAYVVSEIDGSKVNLEDISPYVPAETPVILESSYSLASDNKLQLLATTVNLSFAANNLKGVYFNHDAGGKHTVRTAFAKKTMRLLTVKDGEIAFVNEGDAYIPANTAYLQVPSGTSSTLTIGKISSSSSTIPGTQEDPENKMNHGTATNPISVADAIANAKAIGSTASAKDFYVKGKISSIKFEYSAQYGTATYNISDDGSTETEFTVYGSYYFDSKSWQEGQTQIAVGDEVIVCGRIINYNGKTPEFADKKNYLVSLNGKTSSEVGPVENPEDKMDHGTATAPISVADAITDAVAIGTNASINDFYVKGKISSIKYEYSAEYGTATYNISEDGSEGTAFTVYNSYYFDNKSWQEGDNQIAVGDEVIVCGKIINYNGNTPEFADKQSHLISLNGKTSSEIVPVENPEDKMNHGTATSPISVADAIANAKAIGSTASAKDFYVKGKISSIKFEYSAQYGTATYNISDDGSTETEFTVYGSYYFDSKSWQEGQTQIAVGDEVIVCGRIINYNGKTPEFADKKNYLVSLNGKTSSEVGPVENPEDKMDHGTATAPISVADAITDAVAIGTNASINDFYVKGKISSIKYEYSAEYGTATYNISEDGSEGTAFTVYNSYYFDNKSWQEGDNQIAVGDEVIVCGKIINYNGKTPEFVSKQNYLVSLNGNTATGIQNVRFSEMNGMVYNLTGQRVGKPTRKGIYLINGKKVLVK